MLDWLELPGDERTGPEGDLREEAGRGRPAEELVRSGERLYYEGEFAMAAREFRNARNHDPTYFEAWAMEVDARLRAGDVPGADACATAALNTYGKVAVFYAAKALVLAHQGYIQAAYEHSDVSVKHEEASVFTWLSRAEVVLSTQSPGTMRSVESCFQRASRTDPTRWRVKFRAALCLLQWGQVERALERLSQVAELVPRSAFVQKMMGDCHRRLGHDGAAQQCYRLALSRRPDYTPALDALASMTLWGRVRTGVGRLLGRKKK